MSSLVETGGQPGGERRITGKTVLIWLVLFFGTIIAVNLYFVYVALDTWPGLTDQHAYEDGVTYNHTLEEAAAQKALGWRTRVSLSPPTPKGHVLDAILTTRDGKPLTGLEVTAELSRPLGDTLDKKVTLKEDKPGHYGTLVKLPALGRWEVLLHAKGSQSAPYRMKFEFEVGGN